MKKCKQCLQEKEPEEFYAHKLSADGRLPKCKECVKEIRRSPEGRAMARIVDKNRFNDPKRKESQKAYLKKFREENPEKWKAQCAVNNFLRYNKDMKKTRCAVCGLEERIHYHHFDYTKPNEVIPCCPFDHSKFHTGKLEIQPEWILVLPFTL